MFNGLKNLGMDAIGKAMGITEENAFSKLGPLLAPVAKAVSQPKVAAWLQILNEKNLHEGESYCAFVTYERDGKVMTQLYAFTGEGAITRKLGYPMEMDGFIMGLLNADFNISKPKEQETPIAPMEVVKEDIPPIVDAADQDEQINSPVNGNDDNEEIAQ